MARPVTPFALPAADQAALEKFTRNGRRPVRAVRRAQALLALATGMGQQAAGQAVGLSRQAVSKVRRRYEATGWQAALAEAPRSGGPRRFDGAQRAAVTALACTPAPVGHSRWTLRLLADKAVELALVDAISHETVSQVLKKTSCSPTASSAGASGQ
jgi:transposase